MHRPLVAGNFDAQFRKAAQWLLVRGVRPNHFTFLQGPVYVGMMWAAMEAKAWTFVLLGNLVIILDGGDGILARVGGLQSRMGALLDAAFDTIGIAVVVWGGSRFFPDWWPLFAALFIFNVLLYVQNDILGQKAVSYVRGPVLIAIVFPETLYVAVAVAFFIVAWLILARMPRTLHVVRAAAVRRI